MKVLFIYDIRDWSFHNIAENISKACLDRAKASGSADNWQFKLMAREDWAGYPERLMEALSWADLHVFFWRFDLLAAIDMLAAQKTYRKTLAKLLASKVTLSIVYDHLYSDAQDLQDHGNPFLISDLNAVSSGTLRKIYSASPHLFAPDAVLVDGVDLQRFQPSAKTTPDDGKLRVGWVGNSDWGTHKAPDMKGFHGVFRPAMQVMEASNLAVQIVADRATTPVAYCDMPAYYHQIDVMVCSSLIEGTPNPVLEAMASGVAVISTDVGVVREVLGPLQQEFIIDRAPEALTEKLQKLAKDPALLHALKAENIARRQSLSWDARFADWAVLFEKARAMQNSPERIAKKKKRLEQLLQTDKGQLSNVRRRVMSNRFLYKAYMIMMNRFPHTTAKIRNLIR